MAYADFLASKTPVPPAFGVEPKPFRSGVFADFQAAALRWAIRRGRAALFLDTGLGKTRLACEWLRQSGKRGLLVAPMAVGEQTIREARSLGIFGDNIRKVADPTGVDGVDVTNYEKLHRFVGAEYDAIVLDESSILKSIDGATRNLLLDRFTSIPRRLCCSATPAPNDVVELANHAAFLGVMSRTEMLASFFTHDSERTASAGYRLKGHAKAAFWRWVARWAAYVRKPSDLGFDDGLFILPPLNIREESVRADWKPEGMLFGVGLGGIEHRREARRATLDARVARASAIVGDSPDQWIVWCGLNDEGDAIEDALGAETCVQIAGADEEHERIEKELSWREGRVRVLITKAELFGAGLNWQHCHKQLFLGLGDSFEKYYQAIRRCWRFGQKHPVDVIVVTSDAEVAVVDNIKRKEAEAAAMAAGVVEYAREVLMEEIGGKAETAPAFEYAVKEETGDGWRMLLGDCVERVKDVPDSSVGLSMFSPPFASLYTYSASERDMGNAKDDAEFFAHFEFLIPELRRVIMPGRTVVVHCQDLTSKKTTHGYIGKRDFSGEIIRAFLKYGWIYDGRITVDKDPQAAAIRSKSKQLLFVQKERDSNWLMACLPDYLLRFRDPRENAVPVKGDVTNEEWILWARPIWYGIRESETLNAASARAEADEKHIAALQLETIERCVRLWTNKGETVLSPFGGIGSEGVVSLKCDRSYVGIELKPEYFKQATANLRTAKKQLGLFAER